MKKIKVILLAIVVLLCLAFCGCGLFKHTHDYEWVNGEDYTKAYLRCEKCFVRFDPDKLYEEPVHIRGAKDGNFAPIAFVYYEIDVERGRFDYNEEFDISFRIGIDKSYIEPGDFNIKLEESPYFEIVGDKEQSISVSEDTYNKYHTFRFRVKPTTPSNIVRAFDFKMKFNPTKYFIRIASESYADLPWYYDPSDEYFYGTKQLSFISDSHGMFLEDNFRGAYLFHNSINREYLAGVIDKDAYLDRAREYEFSTGTFRAFFEETSGELKGTVRCRYLSANMRAKFNFYIDGKYYEQIKYWKENDEDFRVKLANLLVGILYDKGYISSEEYKKEINYISEMQPNGAAYCLYPEMMPIAEYYKEHYYDYSYVEDNTTSHDLSSDAEADFAVVQLASDRIDVSGGVDLFVHTEFINSIENIDVEIEDGLALCSEIEIIDNKIVLSLLHNEEHETPHFRMKVNMSGEEANSLDIDVYGYANGDYLYLSQWSANEAYNVFIDYSNATVEQEITFEAIQQEIKEENNQDNSNVSTSYEITDTEIRGTLYWEEFRCENEEKEARVFPLQYCIVSFYDREAVGQRYIGSCLTNDKGEYRFKFLNDTSLFEGGLDITIRVWAAGEDVSVTHGPQWLPILYVYHNDIMLDNNISSEIHVLDSVIFKMIDCDGNTALFGQALQISQAAIFASKYYEEMKGTDVIDVPIVYPHNQGISNCFYSSEDSPDGRIYIVGDTKSTYDLSLRSYESWDSIMHEYGHFVADKEGIDASPRGWHGSGNTPMGEHYIKHAFGETVTGDCNNQCANGDRTMSATEAKGAGMAIAWSEGWATYFAMVAQEYYSEQLAGIETVANQTYESYLASYILVGRGRGTTEDTESTVYSILYDIYDSPPQSSDSYDDDFGKSFLSFGHETLWHTIMKSKATTFDEFDDYFKDYYEYMSVCEKYGALLSYHNIAPGDRYNDDDEIVPGVALEGKLTTNCPTFLCTWNEVDDDLHIDARRFALNFYSEDRILIGTTEVQEGTCFTIDEALWQRVIDWGTTFYVSATIIENHEPKTDYEGQWYKFNFSIQPAKINVNYTETLVIEDCYWYEFIVSQTGQYVFSTTGNTDTVGEILNGLVAGHSTEGLIDYDDNGGAANNFSISKYLELGEIVLIRVRGADWSATGEYTFKIEYVNHQHEYTYRYVSNGAFYHKAYCVCGEYDLETHVWYAGITNNYCKHCGFVTTGGPVVRPDCVENDMYVLLNDDDDEQTSL